MSPRRQPNVSALTVLGVASLFIMGCKGTSEPAPQPASTSASVGRESAPSSDFSWVSVRPGSAAAPEEHPAKLLRTSASEAVVVAPLTARVMSLLVKPGDAVDKGAPIAVVVMPELDSASASVAAADASLAVLQKRRERLGKLEGEGLVRDADVAALDLEIARHQAERLRGRAIVQAAGGAQGGSVTLRTPLGGVVMEIGATLGELRRPEDGPLARVRNRTGQRIEATLPQKPALDGRYSFHGADGDFEVRLVNQVTAPSGLGYLAWFEAAPNVELPSANEGRLRIAAPIGADLFAVPASAVGQDGPRRFVVVCTPKGEGSKVVEVELVRLANAEALVRGPLEEAQRVATAPERAAEAQRGGAAK